MSDTKYRNNKENDQVRIGVFVCDCGTNIAGVVDVPKVVEFASDLDNVVFSEEGKWICSVDYLTKIKDYISEHNLDRVVVACCTPRTHEPTFKTTVKEAGLNPLLLEFVSIREQSSWVHKEDPKLATETAKDLVRMGVAKARYLEPGEEIRIPVGRKCMVIGGGIAGMTAALALGDFGYKVILVERKEKLGGVLNQLYKLAPHDIYADEFLKPRIERILNHKNISILLNHMVSDINGYVGNFKVKLMKNSSSNNSKNSENYSEHDISTIIVATGLKELEPIGMFGYGKFKNVITQLQLEEMLRNNEDKLSEIDNIAFINCVNSRNEDRGCCNVGCLTSIKNIKALKECKPNINAFLFFRDFNITGMDVQYHYNFMDKYEASFRFLDSKPPMVLKRELIQDRHVLSESYSKNNNQNKKISVQSYDILTGTDVKVDVDLLVLTPGYVGDPTNEQLKGLLKVSTNSDGFFQEAHVKLRPLDFANEGIYVCGCARSPKDVYETLEESLGAAMRAAIPMNKGFVETEGIVAEVEPETCISCGICIETCAYKAPELIENKAEIIKAICKGCGTCVASCPSEAIDIIHFSDTQILAQIDAALFEKPENKVVVFACHWCALGAVDNAGVSRFEYPANLRIIRTMCSGRVDPGFIIHAFDRGAAGVLVAGCEFPTCHYISGNFYASKKVRMAIKLLELAGIDTKRVRLEWLSAAQGGKFAQIANEFTNQLNELGPLNKDEYSSLDLQIARICADSQRLRILGSKLKDFVDGGNKYNEIFSEHEIDRLIEDMVNDEFIKQKIYSLLHKKNNSVIDLAKEILVSPVSIFKHTINLKQSGLVELDKIEGVTPIYKIIPKKKPIIDYPKTNLIDNGTNQFNQSKNKFDFTIVGSSIHSLNKALELAEIGNAVCLIVSENSFISDPFILKEKFSNFDQQIDDYKKLIEKCYNHNNMTIFRNTIIENEVYLASKKELELLIKTNFVNEDRCDNCGKCLEVCPVNLLDFDTHGLSTKHAIYHPWPSTDSIKFAISKCIPYCQALCPIMMDARGYIGKLASNDLSGAEMVIRRTNPLPDVCGKVCDHMCETTCARGFKDESVEIRKLKRFAIEKQYELLESRNSPILSKQKLLKNNDPTNKVAIIGSGPAGLAAAHDLTQLGYPVTIFEAASVPGGMLRLGIPDFRLPPEDLEREINAVLSLGIELKLNSPIGGDSTIDSLKGQGYKSVFIAVGAQKSLSLGIEGESLHGVINGLEFLKKINTRDKKITVKIGQNVAVIGGGNVAIDCARTVKRIGAENVNILYRRSKHEMLASKDEIEECEEEGIKINFQVSPKIIIGTEDEGSAGEVKAIECQRTELGSLDSSGRRRPTIVEGSEFKLEIDTVLVAVGQQPELNFLTEQDNFELTPRSTFIINEKTGETNVKGVFAGGDVVTGPSTVIKAIKSGKIAALAIDEYLNGVLSVKSIKKITIPGEKRINELELIRLRKNLLMLSSEPPDYRNPKNLLESVKRITSFAEVELPISYKEAKEEAKRCLSCRMCIGCGVCQSACPQEAIDYTLEDEIRIIETNEVLNYPQLLEGRFDNVSLKKFYMNSLNVLSPMELEYMVMPNGVFNNMILRPFDGEAPKKIAFVYQSENEYVTEDDRRLNNLELEYILRLIRYLIKTHPEINITLFSNLKRSSEFPDKYRNLNNKGNTFKEIKDEIKYIFIDKIIKNKQNDFGNIEIEYSGKKYNFELAIVNTGLKFV